MGSANSGAVFHFPRHGLTQFNHRHGVVAAPVVAGDGEKVVGSQHVVGRGGFAHGKRDQGQQTRVAARGGQALGGSTFGEFWKYRVGDFRIIASIQDDRMIVLVLRVGNRSDIYRSRETSTFDRWRFLRFPDACFCCLSENTPAGLIFQSDLSENSAKSQFVK